MDSQAHTPDAHTPDKDQGNGIEISTEDARAGATPHMTRYILGWGLFLVIIAFVAVLGFHNFNG
jgi:hypothetical protein